MSDTFGLVGRISRTGVRSVVARARGCASDARAVAALATCKQDDGKNNSGAAHVRGLLDALNQHASRPFERIVAPLQGFL